MRQDLGKLFMSISKNTLEEIARLAYLNLEPGSEAQLNQEISSIIDFVAQLQSLNTEQTAPLFHPFALHQRQRDDEVTEEACLAQLEEIAPLFEDDLYLVPKVIEVDK